MMSIRWKDPLSTMFPSLWSASSRSGSKAATKTTISLPTQDSFNHQKHNRPQLQQLHRDIEAAADQTLTPVFVQPTSTHSLPLPPGTGNSITSSSRTQHQDGDPFYRRSVATNQLINGDGSGETSTTSTIPNMPQQQQVSSSTVASYSDAIPNGSSRSGNFPLPDVLLVDNTSGSMPRSTSVARGGGVNGGGVAKALIVEPRLIHP